MCPSFVTDNTPYGSLGNFIESCHFGLRNALRPKPANFSDIGHTQFYRWMRLATVATVAISAFCQHISNIVRGCAKKQMVRIHAGWIIAFMKYPKVIWYWAVVQFPGMAMRSPRTAINIYLSISTDIGRTLPFPTLIWAKFIHFLPKAFHDRTEVVVSDAPRVVVLDKASGLAFYRVLALVCHFRNWGQLSTTALAITVWDFLRGMIHDSNSPFVTLLTPPNGSNRCGGNFMHSTRSIIAQVSA